MPLYIKRCYAFLSTHDTSQRIVFHYCRSIFLSYSCIEMTNDCLVLGFYESTFSYASTTRNKKAASSVRSVNNEWAVLNALDCSSARRSYSSRINSSTPSSSSSKSHAFTCWNVSLFAGIIYECWLKTSARNSTSISFCSFRHGRNNIISTR